MKLRKMLVVIVILVMMFAYVSPAMAQEGGPVGTPTGEEIIGEGIEEDTPIDFEVWKEVAKNFLVAIVVGVGVILMTERGTEIGKIILRLVSKSKFTKFLYLKGTGSVALAIFVAFVTVYQFDVQLLERFAILKEAVNPELLKIMTTTLIWLGSNTLHSELPESLDIAKRIKPYVKK